MECRARLRQWIRLAVSAIPLLAMPAVAAQLSLSWVDNATNEAGFRIERSLIPSTTYVPIASVGPNVTTYVDPTVTSGQGYCYRVQAFNDVGTSGYSNASCATVPAASPTTYTVTVTKAGLGTGTVSGPGISCGADCVESVTSGTAVTLTATSAAGSTFTGWSGACSGTGTCTVSATTTVTATFTPIYTVTVTKAGLGTGTVSGPGISCGADCVESVTSGTAVTLTATSAAGSTFTGWSGACSGTGTCTVSATTTVTATFTPIYTVTVTKAGLGTGTVSGPGISCGADCVESVTSGTAVTLTATSAAGSTFTGWSGACSGTGACTVSATTTVTATFVPIYTLTVTKAGAGTGTVTVSGPGISCSAECVKSVASGTTVILTAAPATGSAFAGWSGACSGTGPCTVTVSATTTVTATFVPIYTLTVTKAGAGTGTVSGPGISCGADCAESVTSGTAVTLTATSAAGSTFAGWSGACGGAGPCTVTVSATMAVSATFDSTLAVAAVEIVTGAAPGSAPRVRGLTRAGAQTTTDFLAYAESFMGGVFVGLGSLSSAGGPLIVTSSGAGIPTEVRAFRSDGSSVGPSFRPYGKYFKGGARLAVCDVYGDGTEQIVTVPGPGYRADVAIWRLSSRKVTKVLSFTVGRATRGAYVACGDLDGDGTSEIVVSFDRGVGPEVRVYRVVGTGVTLVTSFLAYEPSFTGGVRVAMADVDGDGLLDVITAPGAGREPVVRALKLSGQTVTELAAFDAEEPGFAGGLYVAGGKRDDLGGAAVMTSPGSGGVPNLRIFSVSPVVVLESTNVIVDDPTGSHGVTLGASP